MTKQFEETLRRLLGKLDSPLDAIYNGALPQEMTREYQDAIAAGNLRKELIDMLDKADRGAKWRQVTLIELIENEKRQV